ncbi:MAG: lipoprotein [Moraxella sp.]|nr:lipoprotein [Moraxella sp.]
MKTALILALSCTLVAMSLTACGQKGALYLPQKAEPTPTTPAQEPVSTDPNDY